jgi:predicted RNA binding protein YcfA (HicA-like mRNA interferase family)
LLSKLSPAKPHEVVRVLLRLGFNFVRQKGSHAIFEHPDGRRVTVPIHPGKDIAVGILRKILRDANLMPDEFNRLR